MKKHHFTLLLLFSYWMLIGQTDFWTDINQGALSSNISRENLPTQFRALSLDFENFQKKLSKAPSEFSNKKGLEIALPMPDGSMEIMGIWTSSIMEEGLANRYPNIKTFIGKSISNSLTISRLGYSKIGFHAIIQTTEGTVFIEPLMDGTSQYYLASYAKYGNVGQEIEAFKRTCSAFSENTFSEKNNHLEKEKTAKSRSGNDPVDLYIYEAAIACSGEYAQYHQANTKEEALSHIVVTMNQANSIFERDLALRMVLIEENDSLIFLDPTDDPYTDGSSVASSYAENPRVIETIIDPNKFDIGHVFVAKCIGGVVGIGGGKVCDASKSSGISCQFTSDAQFAINIVCHEMGHQLYANHSWANCPGNEDNYAGGTAYEPGSGSTIMSYSGACGSNNNIQSTSDPYFHVTNLQEILTDKLTGRTKGCAQIIPTENLKPTAIIHYEDGFYIPINTPFDLVGDGMDENGDVLTYCWEQYNTGPSTDLGMPAGTAPAFRSLPPTTNPIRTFPKLSDLINNRMDVREVLPTYSRKLNFRLTVRDNHSEAGGVDWQEVSFFATDQAGPFLLNFPNSAMDSVRIGDYIEVKWDVANTNTSPVNCQKVNILLSIDGGETYSHTLIANTENDGSQFVTIPDLLSDEARIRVEAADNIFFDISNSNFSILSPLKAGFSFGAAVENRQVCLPGTLEIDLQFYALLGFDNPISLSAMFEQPIDFSFDFENTYTPEENGKAYITFDEMAMRGSNTLVLTATAENADPVRREIDLELVGNQFNDFTLVEPANNVSGIGLPAFQWMASDDAKSYEIEIATNPAFGSHIVEVATNLVAPPHTPGSPLEENTIYYWRMRPVNDCGAGPYSEIFAFQTETLSCLAESSTEVPVLISSQGTPTIESSLTITQDFQISDVNVPKIRGSHDWVSHIRTTLISPAGTEVILFTGECPGAVPFNLGFDDEASTILPCPPIGGALHQAHEPLSKFDGESTFGNWTMQIKVLDDFGEGGSLDEWSLEFCANVSLQSPELVKNDTLSVKPQSGRLIESTFLLSEDANNTATELVYTLVKLPEQGSLFLNETLLEVGAQFTQNDIDKGFLKYKHESDATTGADQFSFTVTDGEGGWIGITPFDIFINPDETVVGTNNFIKNNLIVLYPNPANEVVYLEFKEAISVDAFLEILDVQGKIIKRQVIDNQNFVKILISNFKSGIYLFKIHFEEGVVVKKVIVI